jgi:hypothetical protein
MRLFWSRHIVVNCDVFQAEVQVTVFFQTCFEILFMFIILLG